MLSQLDHITFPDRCEVYETMPSQRYVYAIFKNGSSGLVEGSTQKQWRVFLNEQIKRLDSIDIILREPKARTISGINIYLQQLIQQNPSLDRATAIWFIKNYLFLNRHYCPQFFWLINLARYLKADTLLNFYDMAELSIIVGKDTKPFMYKEVTKEFAQEIGEIPNIEMYHRVDQAIIDQCQGKTLNFAQMIQYIRNADPAAFEYVLGRATKILGSVNALS